MKRYTIVFKLIHEAEMDCKILEVESVGMHMADAIEKFRAGTWMTELLDDCLGMEILTCTLIQ